MSRLDPLFNHLNCTMTCKSCGADVTTEYTTAGRFNIAHRGKVCAPFNMVMCKTPSRFPSLVQIQTMQCRHCGARVTIGDNGNICHRGLCVPFQKAAAECGYTDIDVEDVKAHIEGKNS